MADRAYHPSYRPDIDGLRAIAVLAVVVFHAFPGHMRGGFIGVDVFFVISGYLIGSIILKGVSQGSFSFADFYARRVRRIFPALMVVLATCLVAGQILLLPDENARLARHTIGAALFVSNFQMLGESGYFDLDAHFKPLLHLWSLGIEEQFYIVLPVAMVVAARLKWPLTALVAGAMLVSFAWNVIETGNDRIAAFYLPMTQFWELFAGVVLAGIVLFGLGKGKAASRAKALLGKTDPRFLSHAASIGGLALILLAAFKLRDWMAFPGWLALLPVAGSVLLIAAGPDGIVNRYLLAQKWVVYIGLISYPLYLWHWPLLSFAWIVELREPTLLTRWVLVVLAFVLAALTYHLVERPIRFGGGRKIVAALAGSVVAVVLAGLMLLSPSQVGLDGIAVSADAEKQRRAVLAEGQCHFGAGGVDLKKLSNCLRLAEGQPNILVVGDSHAADTRLALQSGYPEINFAAATGSGCRPIEEHHKSAPDRRHCAVLLGHVKRGYPELSKLDGVVLTARWNTAVNFKSLYNEVEFYRGKGLKVVVFGPTFEYTAPLPAIVARFGGASSDLRRYQNKDMVLRDRKMREALAKIGVPYVSKIAVLCVAGDCPAVSEAGAPLLADEAHWAPEGARRFGLMMRDKKVLETAFGELGPEPPAPVAAPATADTAIVR